MTEYSIEVERLRKRFGRTEAVAGVDLAVPAGTVCGLLGPNGAGKTTIVRILATLVRPDGGHARINGYDVTRDAAQVRRHIGLAGQYAAVDERLTGRANLVMIGRLAHHTARAARRRADELLDQFGLTGAAGRLARTYSGGMRRRLDLAASLVVAPAVLFLDEPTTGLDPRSRMGIWETLAKLVAGGTTLLLTTQYLDEADRLADQIVVLDQGRVAAAGSPATLKSSVGGERIDVVVHDPGRFAEAAVVLRAAAPDISAEDGRITVPAREGGRSLIQVARALDEAGIEVEDIALRRPTLDEVFLRLTEVSR